jgi:site-specific recombinase XerD
LLDQLIDDKKQSYSIVSLDQLIAQNELDRYLFLFLITKENEQNLSLRTIHDYKQKISRFTSWTKKKVLAEITREDIQIYLHELRKTCKPVSVLGYFTNLRVWFNWLVNNDYLDKSPMAKMQKPKVTVEIVEPLRIKDIEKMLLVCSTNDFMAVRNRLIILMLLDTGLRLSELASIKLDDIDPGRHIIKILGKGAKERVVAIGVKAYAALARYVTARLDRLNRLRRKNIDYLFISDECRRLTPWGIYIAIKTIASRAGVEGRCHPHKFRHTSGTMALLNGASEREVQLMLGHSTPLMTK